MAEHFCDHKYKPNTNTCVFGGTFLLFRSLPQHSPTEESQPKHWMRTRKTQNNNINKRLQDTWQKKTLKRFFSCPSFYLSWFGELQPPKSKHPCFSFHHNLNLDQEKDNMRHVESSLITWSSPMTLTVPSMPSSILTWLLWRWLGCEWWNNPLNFLLSKWYIQPHFRSLQGPAELLRFKNYFL